MEIIENEYKNNVEKQVYLNDLKKIIVSTCEVIEETYFYDEMLNLDVNLYKKQLNLFWQGKESNHNICEIGFTTGHSVMLMLLGRSKLPLNFTIFSNQFKPSIESCLKYLKEKFSYVNFELLERNSIIVIPERLLGIYDIVHVNSSQTEDSIVNDLKNADLLVKVNGIIIVNNTNIKYINNNVNSFILSGKYIQLNVFDTFKYTKSHRIIKKIK